jgi:hypothetical protein
LNPADADRATSGRHLSPLLTGSVKHQALDPRRQPDVEELVRITHEHPSQSNSGVCL